MPSGERLEGRAEEKAAKEWDEYTIQKNEGGLLRGLARAPIGSRPVYESPSAMNSKPAFFCGEDMNTIS